MTGSTASPPPALAASRDAWLVAAAARSADELLAALAFARPVRAGHERFDGSGYPDGLVAGEIPLTSRIVMVSDAYHAMTSERPYRAAMSPDDAHAELRRNAGTQFCPEVTAAALAALGG